MNWRDEPMFELPPAVPVKRAKTLRDMDREARPRITRYRTAGRTPCDECVLVLHEANGVGPYARAARWRAAYKGRVLFLCNEHADLRRVEWTAA